MFMNPQSSDLQSMISGMSSSPSPDASQDHDFKSDFVGFQVSSSEFLVGFSVDYKERFRDLDHLCVLNEFGCRSLNSPGLARTPLRGV